MEDLIGLGSSALAGGITGILGNVINRGFAFFERRQAQSFQVKQWENDRELRDHEKAMNEAEHAQVLELHNANRLAATEEHERAVNLAEIKTSAEGLKATIGEQTKLVQTVGQWPWVNDFMKLWRPVLTLIAILMLFYFSAKGVIDPAMVAATFAYLATASYLYWFGERATEKTLKLIFGERYVN